jgi:hypothetical protein
MGLPVLAAHMGEVINANKILTGNPHGKKSLMFAKTEFLRFINIYLTAYV